MKNFLNFLSGIFVFYLLFLFLKWYIKGHTGKYFIFFWLNTIFALFIFFCIRIPQMEDSETLKGY